MSEALPSSLTERSVLHLIPGISASGKTTAARHIVDRLNRNVTTARLVVPHTTRPKREHERDGIDYHFHDLGEFETDFLPRCNDPEDEWDASKIGDHYYFNTASETRPSDTHRVSILPVAFSALNESVEDYSSDDYNLTILPIVIDNKLKPKWLPSAQQQRPSRDLEGELDEQDSFLKGYDGEVFYPTWQGSVDFERYYDQASILMTAARTMINSTMNEEY